MDEYIYETYEQYLASGEWDGAMVHDEGSNETNRLPFCTFCHPDPLINSTAYLTYNFLVTGLALPTIGLLGILGNGISAFVYSRRSMRWLDC